MYLINTGNIIPETEPFPHAIVEDFLTPETYSDLLHQLPATNLYTPLPGEEGRCDFWLQRDRQLLTAQQKAFWAAIYQLFAFKQKSEVFAPFRKYFENYPELTSVSLANTTPYLRLVKEVCPYTKLMPHLDDNHKVLVLVLYLSPEQNSVPKSEGTALYKRVNNEFVLVKTAPFVGNTCCVTLRTRDSWHGGNWQEAGERNTLHVYYFYR